MNANELADAIDKYLDSILEEAIHPIEDVLNESISMLRKQQEEIQYWRSAFEKSMVLVEQIRHLETQVYGGTTK